MKKWIASMLVLVLLAALAMPAMAENGGFISSPSGAQAPEVLKWEAACNTEVIATAYNQRNTLAASQYSKMVVAYNHIKASPNLTVLCSALTTLAGQMQISGKDLAVSDLFDLSCTDCGREDHAEGSHGLVTVTLKADTLKNFVGLIHYESGKWELVEDAKLVDGDLRFTVDSFSPFAIVVNAAQSNQQTPGTGDGAADNSGVPTGLIVVLALVVVASGAALVLCLLKIRKNGAK